MTPEQVTNAIMSHVAARMVPAVDTVAGEIAAEVRDSINVPVGRSGSKIIRSKPGEPPRREFGKYYKSWSHRTKQAGDIITGIAGSTLPGRGQWLEKGTGRIKPRPHVSRVFERARTTAADRIK